jgi:hypothetical protein
MLPRFDLGWPAWSGRLGRRQRLRQRNGAEPFIRTSGHTAEDAAGFTDPDRLVQIADGRGRELRLTGYSDCGAGAERSDQGGGGDGGGNDELAHGGVPLVGGPAGRSMCPFTSDAVIAQIGPGACDPRHSRIEVIDFAR